MKSITQLPRWLVWSLILPLIILNGWLLLVVFKYFQSLIAIFVAASLLAFILNYPADFLTNQGIKRYQAVLVVIALSVLVLVLLGVTLVPLIWQQLNDLVSRLPAWIESGSQQLQSLSDWAEARNLPINLEGIATGLTTRLTGQLRSLTGQILGLALGTVGSLLNVVLTVVLTFYLLFNGRQLWDGVVEWLPQPFGDQLRLAISQSFHNYFVGQASLAALVGVTMTSAFLMLRVPYGLLFGVGVGLMALFPFGVSLSIGLVSSLTALKSFWLGVRVLAVAAIIQQIMENLVAPRLLSGFIGLNPVWILLSLLVGAKIGGILGLLIAVPVAGFIKTTAQLWRASLASQEGEESFRQQVIIR
ncbi:MAG: AI-2E family transporter [Chloroflexaceae bacterium]|nr:AI-2E family transporter [Chloroflexaceae bacterium]